VQRLAPIELSPNWTSVVGALHGVLHALGETMQPWQLMGVTGHAFRIALTEHDGVIAGGSQAAAVDFLRMLPLYRNSGRRFELITADPAARDFPKRRADALKRIRRSIDRGRPVIAYDLHIPEFGIIFGYDDRAQTLTVRSLMSAQYGEALTESRWPVPERGGRLIVLLAGDRERVDPARALRDALRFAVEYAEHGDPGDPMGASHGVAAYARWREAFEQGRMVDAGGNALTIQTVQNARRDAAQFLRDAAVRLQSDAGLLSEAAAAYDREALALSRMATFFPYPSGGDVGGPGARIVAVGALREAEEHERTAIRLLRKTGG
jgi:hypothetical protein